MTEPSWIPKVEIPMSMYGMIHILPAINERMELLVARMMEETEATEFVKETIETLSVLSTIRKEIETTLYLCFDNEYPIDLGE
jgi:hypothetical protein